jgi:hypothetical protein
MNTKNLMITHVNDQIRNSNFNSEDLLRVITGKAGKERMVSMYRAVASCHKDARYTSRFQRLKDTPHTCVI